MYSLGIASRWGEISTNIYTGMRPTLPPIPLVLCLSHRYSGQSVVLTTHPHQAPKLNREESCTSTVPLALCGLSRVNFAFT